MKSKKKLVTEDASKTKKEYKKPKAEVTKISLGVWGGSCSGSCLSPLTKIKTSMGDKYVRSLKIGDVIWTQNKIGQKVTAPIIKKAKVSVSKRHMIMHLSFANGKTLFISPDHPVAGTKKIRQLSIGEKYDNSYITNIQLIPYKKPYTYDILPKGDTGFYWANDILMGSTLREEKVELVVETFKRLEFLSL